MTARFGFRKVLVVNTLMIGLTVSLFSLVVANTQLRSIIALSLAQGFFNSLQFTSMNAMAYADIDPKDSSMASTMGNAIFALALVSFCCRRLMMVWCWEIDLQLDMWRLAEF